MRYDERRPRFWRHERERDSRSQPYGQREPYNARGGSRRSRWGGPWNDDNSRYSESQYGVGAKRSRFDAYGGGQEPQLGEGPFADTSESPRFFGTEPAPREPRRYRTGPKGYTRSDERILEDICERLMRADSIDSSEVTVIVKDGRVTLDGTVPTRRMKHAIEDLADDTAGVQDIDNRVCMDAAPGVDPKATKQ